MKIVIALPLTEAQKQSFLDASQGNEIVFKDCGDVSGSVLTLGAITEEDVKDADAIIGNAPLKVVRQASKLKWMQLSSAGSDAYDKPNALPNNALLTAASGAYGVAVSEHLLACILSLKKGLHLYRDNMLAAVPESSSPIRATTDPIAAGGSMMSIHLVPQKCMIVATIQNISPVMTNPPSAY